jgi:hypothetical protein
MANGKYDIASEKIWGFSCFHGRYLIMTSVADHRKGAKPIDDLGIPAI